eukprot:Skav205174  [mRNA]  locus=scaffold1525:100932:107575:- [translate_table: standard]
MEGNRASLPSASEAEPAENKGILWGKSLEEAKNIGISLTGDNLDIKVLFGDLEGSALLEQIFKFWGDGERDNATGVPASSGGIPSDLTCVPLEIVNTFSDITVESGESVFATSLEATSLGLEKMQFSSAFFKFLQSQLEAALWQSYLKQNTREADTVIVNLAAKKTEIMVKYPICSELKLPYVGKVTMVKTKTCLPFVTLFGVPFYIEDPQSSDILVPAWNCKTVTRADVAYFKMHSQPCKVVLIDVQPSHSGTDQDDRADPVVPCLSVELVHAPEGSTDFELVPSWALSYSYCVADATLTSLVPLPDVQEKVTKEVNMQQQRAEKQARTQVEQFLKQRKDSNQQHNAKGKKSKASTSKGSAVDQLAESLYVHGLPEDPAEKVVALQELLATSEKLDNIIEQAKKKISVPDRVAITKMASEEARTTSSGRHKAMQDALMAAKREEEGKGTDQEKLDSKPSVGLSALRAHAEKTGSIQCVKKKDKKSNTSAASSDMAKLGKHLLR